MKRALQPIITNDLCSHGCGTQAKYITKYKPFKLCCSEYTMKCESVRKKNSEGSLKAIKNKTRRCYKTQYELLPQETKDRMAWAKGLTVTTFEKCKSAEKRKTFIIQERGHKCEICNLSTWMDKKIVLEMDHIDGNRDNNIRDNLRLLCPNCHSQTKTWKGKNISKKVIPTEEIIKVINEFIGLNEKFNITNILCKVGLTPLGHNYKRIYKILDEMGIDYNAVRKISKHDKN